MQQLQQHLQQQQQVLLLDGQLHVSCAGRCNKAAMPNSLHSQSE
jgi:hypothetical protein